MTAIEELNQQFGITSAVRFEAGNGGLARLVAKGARAAASIYLQGAHVCHFQPDQQPPVLFMSRESDFEPGKAIRGGVPVCFPWFGIKRDDPDAAKHGFARLLDWQVVSVMMTPQQDVRLVLQLVSNEHTRRFWPHDFELRYSVSIGDTLEMSLETKNTDDRAYTFELALHTYLAVEDARAVKIHGLEQTTYLDKVGGSQEKTEVPSALVISGETDRVYQNTQATCVLEDTKLRRQIKIAKRGSNTTVLWNPWSQQAAQMPDLGDEQWMHMVCIETACAAQGAITLEPGQIHTMSAHIEVEPIS